MKNKVLYCFATIGVLFSIFIFIPVAIGCLVSIKGPEWLNLDNQWISFWGNYLGALVGGILSGLVAVYVMRETIKYENSERDRKEKIEFCLRINEYIMDYASKIGNYCMIFYNDKISEIDKAKEYNELIRLSGIINSLLNSKVENKKYKGINKFGEISSKLIMKICELENNKNVETSNIVDLANELRKYSADFMEMNQ